MTALAAGLLLATATWFVLPGPVHLRSSREDGAGPGRGLRLRPRGSSGAGASGPVTEAMELLALALETGLPVESALRAVADVLGGPGGARLRSVAAAVAWGLEDRAAWTVAGPAWEPVAEALTLARRVGAPPADLLRSAAEDERRRRARLAEERAAALPVRLVLPLGVLFLPAFLMTTVLPVVVALAAQLIVTG